MKIEIRYTWITVAEYAKRYKRSVSAIHQHIYHHRFKNIVRAGRMYLIDQDEPYPTDQRLKKLSDFVAQRNKTNKIS